MKRLGSPTEGEAISTKAKNDKYHRILEAAVTVFAQSGFHESTISQIARAAGVADARDVILEALQEEGSLPLHDASPPEQIRDASKVDHRADLYGLGCLLLR